MSVTIHMSSEAWSMAFYFSLVLLVPACLVNSGYNIGGKHSLHLENGLMNKKKLWYEKAA